MVATVLLRHRKLLTSLYSRFSSTSEGLSSNRRKSGIFQYLSSRFYDIESIVEISRKLKRWKMEKGNKYDADLHQRYGNDIGAAIFVLKLHGGIRFQDQMDWYREDPKQKESINFPDYSGKLLEAIDLRGSSISYIGLKNFANLKGVKHLDLSGCPLVDNWCLNLLHPFGDSLQTLSLAGCPQITEKGLPCLHHFENLERLDVSNLPSVSHPLLLRILLEEMLPQCYIVGMDDQEHTGSPTERENKGIFPTPSKISA